MVRAEVDIARFRNMLRGIGRDALPEAVALALNETAEAVHKAALKNVKKTFVIRTKFTTNSIRVFNKASGDDINKMFARVGSISPYLADHDQGESYPERETLPTLAARKRNYKNSVVRRWRHDKIGEFRTTYAGSGSAFMGTPRGSDGRPYGIYVRHNANKRLTMVKVVTTKTPKVDAKEWFSQPVKRFGTIEFTHDRFHKAAIEMLKKKGVIVR